MICFGLNGNAAVTISACIVFGLTAFESEGLAYTFAHSIAEVEASTEASSRHPVQAIVNLAWWNDFFSGMNSDDGFTNDIELDVGVLTGGQLFSFEGRHRMLTERDGMRRWDLLEATLSWHYTTTVLKGFSLIIRPHAGLALAGDLGGMAMQNSFHGLPGITGRKENLGLQNIYMGGNVAGATVGGELSVETSPVKWFTARARTDLQGAMFGTGLSWLMLSAGGRVHLPGGVVRPYAEVEVTGAIFHTADKNLLMPGGYNEDQVQLILRTLIGLRISQWAFGWNFVYNDGGSGQATAAIFLEYCGWDKL
jgi:hypothetical protein